MATTLQNGWFPKIKCTIRSLFYQVRKKHHPTYDYKRDVGWIKKALSNFVYYFCMIFMVILFFFDFIRVCVDGHTQTVVPGNIRSCVKPRRCITSSWTPWAEDLNSACIENQRRLGRLKRQRRIEQLPLGSGVCPHVVEFKPWLGQTSNATKCQPQYQLVASGWSDCQVKSFSNLSYL